eukprot:TRINITY_DN3121_c0_g1_i1.p1 TRINITY_DN3121_c0_g1~~TRINITY_DN3121_c0_g1_i1.p1  ORF type:complete len:356 (-),score=33.99 TRINITY_DN3121_c0_g1_i1:52-1119(-)
MEGKEQIIFITGATGFVGNRLIEVFTEEWMKNGNPNHYKIRVISREWGSYHFYPNLTRLAKERPDLFEICWGPLENREAVLKAMTGNIVEIYHCAAKGGDWGDKQVFWDSNVNGTQNVVDGALGLTSLKRFLHVSTVDVYPPDVDTKNCDESIAIPTKRRAWYSITKALAEQIVLKAKAEHNLPVTIVRPAAVFGPGTWSFGLVEAQVLYDRKGVLISGGQNACGAIYIDDCIEHMIQAARSPNTIGKIYNSSAYHKETWRMYYDAIADGIKVPRPHWSIPLWFAKIVAWLMETIWWLRGWKERPYLTLFLLGLIGRPQLWPIGASERDFGWRPRFSFQEAMSRHCAWLNTQDLS